MNRKYEKHAWFFAAALLLMVYFLGLFVDVTGDSGLYAAITRQMVESGDWLNLKINGEPYDQKPHLLFWLAGIGIELFGNTNFAFKLFPAIFGGLTFYFVFRLGKFLYNNETGVIAALILASSQISILYFLDIHTDTILQTGVLLAVWQLLVYLQKRESINFIFGFIGVGLAMLSKGPVGAIIPFFVVLIYLILSKNFGQLFRFKWFLGIAICLIIISPALVHLYQSFGWEGLTFYFITNNFGRISGEYSGSSKDLFYYIYNFLWAFLPFTLLGLYFLYREIKSWNRRFLNNPAEKSLLGSIGIFLLILSIAKGKGPNYFLPVFPIFALLTAKWFCSSETIANSIKIIKTQKVLLFVLILFFGVTFFILETENKLLPVIFAVILFVVGILLQKTTNNFSSIILFSVVILTLTNLYAVTKVIPDLFSYQGARQALSVYEKERDKNDILINLHLEEYELFFYANSDVKQFSNWEEFYDLFWQENTWVYTNEGGFKGIQNLNVPLHKVHVITNNGMNNITFSFLNPKTRNETMSKNYLIQIHK